MELAALTGRAPSPAGPDLAVEIADEDIVVLRGRDPDGIEAAPIRMLDPTGRAAAGLVEPVAEVLSARHRFDQLQS